jgi:rhodanese-related sulfurtransferase
VTGRVDTLLATARARLGHRPSPQEAVEAVAAGALLVDIRPVEQRQRDGTIPGAAIVDRNVLEWRLDPQSPWCIAEAVDGPPVIVLCNEGYQSSLAAAGCLDAGCTSATDVDGGFQAWRAAGMPVEVARRFVRPKVGIEVLALGWCGRS